MKISNSLRNLTLLTMFFTVALSVHAQDKLQGQRDSSSSRQKVGQTADSTIDVQSVSAEIRSRRPEIPEQSIASDIALINTVQGEISASLERWTAGDLKEASLIAWKEVRLNSALKPEQAMVRASFVSFVTESTGIMLFESEPDQADVFIGPNKLGTTSKDAGKKLHRTFVDGTTVPVVFSKPDFISELRNCTAVGRDTVECKVELKPVKKP